MVAQATSTPDEDKTADRKISEAQYILAALDFPRAQLNERSALTLLALLDLRPDTPWTNAQKPLVSITPIMDWSQIHYGRKYAPNTRETFRRQTMHQFVEAALVVSNPDKEDRPVNSPKWCYQIEAEAFELLRTFGTDEWNEKLAAYKQVREGLQLRYAQRRKMNQVPITVADGMEIMLTPGNHSKLIKSVIEEFAPRYAPGGKLIYVGDTGAKWAYFDELILRQLGVEVDLRGKMPDVVIYLPTKEWLLLIEAVTSHGPVDGKRHDELAKLFSPVNAGIVFVTAFPTRASMARYVTEISWETEVWIADAPDHLIHFNGVRFLGP